MMRKRRIECFLTSFAVFVLMVVFSCAPVSKDEVVSSPLDNKTNLFSNLMNELKEADGINYRAKNSAFIPPSVWHLGRTDIILTYLGLSIKGSGGGGSFIDGISIINKIDAIDIYDISTVSDDKIYIVAGGIGAPTALKENLDALINSIEASVFTLANLKGKEVGGILSVESGSANATIAMLLSKKMGVPLINADGAGRSVPTLGNLSYAHENYEIAPTVLTSVAKGNPIYDYYENSKGKGLREKKNLIVAVPGGVSVEVLSPKDADDAEKLIRATISKPGFGEIAGLALWAQTGSQLKSSSIIKNAYSDAFLLGLYTYFAMFGGNVYILDDYFKANNQFISSYDGVLTGFSEKTQGGFDITTLTIKAVDGSTITIKALNENLLLTSTKGGIVTAPNLITYLVEVVDGLFIPYNNGDSAIMKSFIGKKIHIVNSYAEKRLYEYEKTFLTTLQKVFGYTGPVVPPGPQK